MHIHHVSLCFCCVLYLQCVLLMCGYQILFVIANLLSGRLPCFVLVVINLSLLSSHCSLYYGYGNFLPGIGFMFSLTS